MHGKGHFGLTLLILSIAFIPLGTGPNQEIVAIILLSAIFSSLPDIDIKFGLPHRKFTHSILFALIIGLILGIFFGYSNLIMGVVGFLAGFLGVMIHLLGDAMTYMAFKPLWPFDNREIAFGFFPANSEIANKGFLALGFIAFFGYIIVTSGALL